jgi:hypothetical protein
MPNSMLMRTLLVLLPLPIVAASPSLETGETGAQIDLGGVTHLECVFPLYVTGTWTDGEPETEVAASDVSFSFEDIDADEGVSDAVGLFGPEYITVRLSGETLHFMQVGSSGPLYVTSVFAEPRDDGKLNAVHTRHEYTRVRLAGFTSRPEQYYGTCEVQSN